MATLPTEIEWQKTHKGGAIFVDIEGATVFTECHGCSSDRLTDRDKIEELRDALDVWLAAHPPDRVL